MPPKKSQPKTKAKPKKGKSEAKAPTKAKETKMNPSPPTNISSPEQPLSPDSDPSSMPSQLATTQVCFRCEQKIYPQEMRKWVGPLRGGKFYCESCFTCHECGKRMTEKIDKFSNNPDDNKDLEIYCPDHARKFVNRTAKPRHE